MYAHSKGIYLHVAISLHANDQIELHLPIYTQCPKDTFSRPPTPTYPNYHNERLAYKYLRPKDIHFHAPTVIYPNYH